VAICTGGNEFATSPEHREKPGAQSPEGRCRRALGSFVEGIVHPLMRVIHRRKSHGRVFARASFGGAPRRASDRLPSSCHPVAGVERT
jgi:hypothetical protein